MEPRVISTNILDDSVVCKIRKRGEEYLFFLWEESYEDRLLENEGWEVDRQDNFPLSKFLREPGLKLISSPYWTCKCKIKYLKIKGVQTQCSVCGEKHPHQKKGFESLKSFFGWDNVYLFRPKYIPEDGDPGFEDTGDE